MEQINYAPLIDKEPPSDLVQECIRQGAFQRKYLIYKNSWEYEPLEDRKVPCVEVTCSACGKTWKAEKVAVDCCHNAAAPAPFGWYNHETNEEVISGMNTLCPMCSTETETKHVGNIRGWIKDFVYMTQLSRIHVEGMTDRLLLVDWQVRRDTGKDGKEAYAVHPWTAWVVEERKVVRLMGYDRHTSSLRQIHLTQRKTFLDDYGKVGGLYPYQEDALIGTTAENSKLDKYIEQGGKYLVGYLALQRKRPHVENLVMQGYGGLVDEMVENENRTYTYERRKGTPKLPDVNWKSKKPHEMLYMEKWQFRQLRRRLTKSGLAALKWAREHGVEIKTPERLEWITAQTAYSCEKLAEAAPDFWKAADYLRKDSKRNVTELVDYWDMAQKCKMDLDVPCVRYPKDLKWSHDYATTRYNELKVELSAEAFRQRAQQLAVFAYQAGGMLIRPCANEKELQEEGKILHHCVYGYAERHAEGRTAILFIRREEEPDKPWFTLEMDETNLTVRQNRGLRNCDPPDEVRQFVVKWLNYIRAQKKKGAHAA